MQKNDAIRHWSGETHVKRDKGEVTEIFCIRLYDSNVEDENLEYLPVVGWEAIKYFEIFKGKSWLVASVQ